MKEAAWAGRGAVHAMGMLGRWKRKAVRRRRWPGGWRRNELAGRPRTRLYGPCLAARGAVPLSSAGPRLRCARGPGFDRPREASSTRLGCRLIDRLRQER